MSEQTSKVFTNKNVNVVLDEMNFLLWKQVLLTVRSHHLEKLLTGAEKPPTETVVVNGAETAATVWSMVLKFFANISTTNVMSLHCRLRSMKKAHVQSENIERAQGGVRANNGQFSGGKSGFCGRGRARLQCQLCGKVGHSVDRCWHMFDQSFSRVLADTFNCDKGCARDNGVFFEFHAKNCLVKDEETGAVLLQGKENGGLYQFPIDSSSKMLTSFSTSQPSGHAYVADSASKVCMSNEIRDGVLIQGVNSQGASSLQHSDAPTENVNEQQLSSQSISQEVADQIPDTTSQDVLVEGASQAQDEHGLHQALDDSHEAGCSLNDTQAHRQDEMIPEVQESVSPREMKPEVQESVSSRGGHHMITRSKNGIHKPKVYLAMQEQAEAEPRTVKEALASSKWKIAVMEDYEALIRNDTWSLVALPEGRIDVGCKWLFRVKRNADGSIQRYKAWLVAKGFSQTLGQDFQDTFSHVVKSTT
ncbi:hypothetical protein GQ457_01G027230 [Hibiscus cannabinus]